MADNFDMPTSDMGDQGGGGVDFNSEFDSFNQRREQESFYSEMRDRGYSSTREIAQEMADAQGIPVEELLAALGEGGLEDGNFPQEGKPRPQNRQARPQAFQPVKFDGEYNELGKVNLDIKSKEQLDGYLEKAILAEKVHEKYTELMAEHEAIKEDAEIGRNLMERLENSPSEFLTETLSDMFFANDPKQVLKFLANTYHQFDGILKNPDAFRASHMEWKNNSAPKVQSSMFEEERNKLAEERNSFTIDMETKKLENWKSSMTSKYADVISHIASTSRDPGWFNNYLQVVMESGMNQVRSGKEFGPKQLEQQLQTLIGPVYNFYKAGAKPGTQKNSKNVNYKPRVGGSTQTKSSSGTNNADAIKRMQQAFNKNLYKG